MKLIIEVPEDIYNHTQAYEIGGFNQENDVRVFDLIKHGIPLEDVKEEIENSAFNYIYIPRVFEILDNIGREERGD